MQIKYRAEGTTLQIGDSFIVGDKGYIIQLDGNDWGPQKSTDGLTGAKLMSMFPAQMAEILCNEHILSFGQNDMEPLVR